MITIESLAYTYKTFFYIGLILGIGLGYFSSSLMHAFIKKSCVKCYSRIGTKALYCECCGQNQYEKY